ncbi:MAG: hypothetical protein HOP37_11905 [Cyclobacteriaceae bacterium]|nr:hypothetical protein [Cyclobacteriaceae bacterium]
MRQHTAIALLLLYLLVNTQLQEIVRIPVLLEHFSEHKQKSQDINFIGFIVLHYFSGDIKDSDYQRDQQLPFRGTHCEEVSISIAIPTDSFEETLPVISYTMAKVGLYVSPFNSSLYQFTIWQPPRA